jgi:hypothetical protein
MAKNPDGKNRQDQVRQEGASAAAAIDTTESPAEAAPPDPPAAGAAAPPASGGKKRMKCESLKGKKVIVGSKVVQIDENGFFEAGAEEAEFLLTIPGYTEA